MTRPRIQLGLQQRAEQQMLLLPRMLQSIEVLQLPALELTAFLRTAFEENEALVLEEPPVGPSTGPAPRGGAEDSAKHDEWLQNQPARAQTLSELVEEQLALLDAEPLLVEWVRFLVSCLDGNGYLPIDDERLLELARDQGLAGDETLLGRAIGALQGLEPRGIGGRDAIETLLLQLDPEDPDYRELCRLLESFLDDVARNKLPAVARAMEMSLGDLERLLGRLRELDLHPARDLSEEAAQTIWPDVVVELVDGVWAVRIEASGQPSVSLDEAVRDLARDREQPPDVRRYLRERIEQARWIVDAVDQRRETLLRVAAAIFHHQRTFLESGPGHLTPLRMTALAEEVGLHVSTVSRSVAGKYVQTPWGVYPLRYFFQAEGGKDGVARDDLRSRVRALIEAEDRSQPLSDDDVALQLSSEGFEVARRTVAKYRKELGIPSSYRRRSWSV